jgi:hypothetical protein
MTAIVSEPNWSEILEIAEASYFKLILIVGSVGSGKTRLLKEVAHYRLHELNFGEEFSRRLINISPRSRAAEAEQVAIDLIAEQNSMKLALDNTEVLFEYPLKLNPLTLLKRFSVDHLIVATWNGVLDNTKLTYGIPGHPAHQTFTYTKQDTFIIVPTINYS